jgi:hypothetical protein
MRGDVMATASERIREIAVDRARKEIERLRQISQCDSSDGKALAEIADRIEEALGILERVAEIGPAPVDD